MPYPNEHACRLSDPDSYDEIGRENEAAEVDGKPVDHLYGIDGDSSELQAMRYPADEWTAEQARSHCTDQDNEEFEEATGEQGGGGMDVPDAPREQLQLGAAIADDETADRPTVRVIPIEEGERVAGFRPDEADEAPAIWDAEPLREAVDQGRLAAPDGSPTKIVKGGGGQNPHHELDSQVPPEDILGKIERWEYKDGIGPVGYAEMVDEEIADRIDAGLLDVSADWFRRLGEYDADRDGKPVDEILALPRVTVLDRGASEGASIEPATAEALGYNPEADGADDPRPATLALELADDTAEQLALYPMQFFSHGEFVGEEFVDDAVTALEEIPGVSAVASESTDRPELVVVLDPDAANLDALNESIQSALDETPFEPVGDFDWVERVAGEMLAGRIGNQTRGAATGSGHSELESPADPDNKGTTMSDDDLREQLANVRAERDTLEEEKEALADDLGDLEDEKEELEEQLADLEADVEAKQEALDDLESEIGPWKEMLARIAADDSMLDPEQVAETQSFEQLSEQVITTFTEDADADDKSPMEMVEEQLAGTPDPRGDGTPDDTPADNLSEEQLAEANSRARDVMGADDVMAAAEEQLSARDYVAQTYGVDPAECDSTSEFRRKVDADGNAAGGD